MSAAQLSMFEPSPCRCGDTPDVNEYPDEVRVGGWCMCPAAVMPIGRGKTMQEAREEYEKALAGSLSVAAKEEG